LDDAIERVSVEIAARVEPFESHIARLDAVPGVGRRTAEALVAEMGTDMTRFPTAAHLASWAGMCPGNHESAGKQQSGKTRSGNKWLKAALVEAAQAIARTRGTYLAAQYRRLAARRGKQKATVAVGHSLLVIAYHLLAHDCEYDDLGPGYFDDRDRQLVKRRLVRRLEDLGYRVALEPLGVTTPAA
jgi:transposase